MSKVIWVSHILNELDLLEVQLATLNSYVDLFIIGQSTKTFQNGDKPLFFNDNLSRFRKYIDKIQHVIIRNMPDGPNDTDEQNLKRCKYQREAVGNTLQYSAEPDDLIISVDMDEIIDPEVVFCFDIKHGDLFAVKMSHYFHKANWLDSDNWHGARMLTYKTLLERFKGSIHEARQFDDPLYIQSGGWHLAYMGSPENIKYKFNSYSHVRNKVKMISQIDSGLSNRHFIPFPDRKLKRVPMQYPHLPKYLIQNIDRFEGIDYED